MANWKYNLKVGHIFHSDELSIQEKGKRIAARIRQIFPSNWFDWDSYEYDSELAELTEALENVTGYDDTSPEEEFDDWWEMFYDWADFNRCSVNTSK